jgi:tRNA1(Val) A37 N6-methylase TrmN6
MIQADDHDKGKSGEEITVLNGRVRLTHLPGGFKTSTDSVLLAAACPAKAGDKVLDMGCGVGGAGLCLMARVTGIHLTGVDIQEAQIALAKQNALLNGYIGEETDFISADIKDFAHEKIFHHVICNPPYLEAGRHVRSPSGQKATAMGHGDPDLSLGDWVRAAHFSLKSNGTLTIIHTAGALDDILRQMGKRFGATEIIPLWPKQGRAAKRVIVRAVKDRRTPATVHPGLVLHKDEGGYTIEADKILKNTEGLYL